ncbi:3'(2'),5'-bisphosphate nucleotidase CysQ [Novosphingobium album (ex Liu et al. 2023)]|uniref:3'(2'),5'-bisphosphate nucleotidase CysQ n=1 Tax=Novosphingobium album (ex Liu et al. 2023) TaxID=3031130 RepID=A0ABT5WNM5_9SPHN|nr:3'(2'),5'-bisphosphate nucleotidase CysQ [Novosphingobium album (ex Liu et al. 2023)]MDE8651632.1 3'(2'),5'-bisphosphate nucleotidase CysQ [Novosphingobium album (ex Liu et al. 2023)]
MIDRARLEAIVREAGRIALAGWPGDGHALTHWHKGDDSPVSESDLAVDTFLKRELRALLPSAGWLSEETADAPERCEGELVWLVDPIDGTRDYIRGRDGWAVSVALVNTRRPLLGYLFAPARRRAQGGEYWHAEAGKGSWRNGERLVASRRAELSGARVPAKVLSVEDADLVPVAQPNSIALRMAMVAAGDADLVATLRWGYEWDIAAAGLIAREAGAAVTDAFGQPLNYNKRDPRAFGVLATSSAIHAAAVARLADRARRIAA